DAPAGGGRRLGHRPGDRKLLAHPEAGRRPHRPASDGGDLRGVRRRRAVRIPRPVPGLAGGGRGQRAVALRARALPRQPAVRRAPAACGSAARHRSRDGSGSRRHRRGQGRRVSEPGTRQLPLALRYPPDQRFETCVGIVPEALAQLRALAAGDDGSGTGVYLAGPAGTGKTHLSLATCAAAEAAGRRAAYLPLQAAGGRMRDALDALERATVVALDGIDAVAGNRDDEVALFDFHNRARTAGAPLLYAGRAAPDGLGPDQGGAARACGAGRRWPARRAARAGAPPRPVGGSGRAGVADGARRPRPGRAGAVARPPGPGVAGSAAEAYGAVPEGDAGG